MRYLFYIFFFCIGVFLTIFVLFLIACFKGIDKKEEDLKDLNELSRQNQTKTGL